MDSNDLILHTQDLNKRFYKPKEFHVLKGINISVKKGEFVSIMGKSGCGKSTLLYILSTMDSSYEGTLTINGEVLTGKSNKQLSDFRNQNLGFVFQFHYLLPEFTVLENVMIPAQKLGRWSKKEIEERAYQKLKLLEIEDEALKKASRLSGGQQQRVAIARSIINDPLLLMGDEPTGNLDSKNADNVLGIFRELSSELGTSLIVVTHDPEFAARTDRTIEMLDGKVIANGNAYNEKL